MRSTLVVFFAPIIMACAATSFTASSEGISSSKREDGVWEIVYVIEAVLPSGGEVTSTDIRGPIEAEATRLCETGLEHLELSPVSIGAGPDGRGLVTRTTGLATCQSSD